ncbi:MAG TPA: hypothetical protein VFH40_09270 [Gemmatimonadales bacterium]|nr:hypothetical protein [Gemmatimonadales bacterium]
MGDRFLIATRKGLFTIQRGRSRLSPWSVVETAFLGDNVSMVLEDPRDGSIWAALDHGHFGAKLHVSHDQGATWTETAAPTFPPKPEGYQEESEPAGGRAIPWTVLRIWSLEAAGKDDPQGLWCGTIPGGLFRSDDGGTSWQLVRSLWDHPKRREWFGGGAEFPGIHSICIEPRNSRRVALGVSCGGVWVTDDLGLTWSCRAQGMRAEYMPPERQFDPYIQDPHRVVRCPAEPRALWASHHNGVFRSTDGAASWQEIDVPPSSFGFAVAVHPRKPDTAWFVPADSDQRRIPIDGRVVVSRTRDGGRTFTELTRGLPQRHAYDLTYRHALDVDESGERLAFGSTTGSLWVTVDEGDTWQTVAEHFPPVYAVRFVGG